MITVSWLVLVLIIWGIDYQALLVVASSVLAVLGVALFAQWSILSNVTASIIVFFTLPARIGDEIEVIDGTQSLKGEIREINFFNVLLVDSEGNEIAYPNNLILQKAVRKCMNREAKSSETKGRLSRVAERIGARGKSDR